jgi:hypothetical protein
LGIIDYNDYIYGLSNDSQILHNILKYNQVSESKVTAIVLADIVQQHSHLLGELGLELLKRVVRLSLPLVTMTLLLGGVTIYENSQSLLGVFV